MTTEAAAILNRINPDDADAARVAADATAQSAQPTEDPMTHDPRMLVSLDCIPKPPQGARVWSDDPFFSDPFVVDARLVIRDDLALDLSAPALRPDGYPDRLDVLPWALRVLGWRHDAIVGKCYGRDDAYEVTHPFFGSQGFVSRECWPRKRGRGYVIGSAWPNLSGLSADDAARAVVAAALREVRR